MIAHAAEDIPSPSCIVPHRSIVLHTGINNIKVKNRRSCKTKSLVLVDEIEAKCNEIFCFYPKCKIFLALPIKSDLLNRRVREFSSMLLDLAHSYTLYTNVHY